ncbi:MAG: hypothetical protein KAV00_02120 [Phycisphaerae bacterium]|nr:hypothetical protein [Phycisphaerae bacterium]
MAEYILTARSSADVDVYMSWLEGKGWSRYSQNPEDGLIEAIFEHIGELNQWCFEVGCGDGLSLSNTRCLREKGWTAILIDQNADLIRSARDKRLSGDCVVEGPLGPLTLDYLLEQEHAPKDMDFGVIDIDGWDVPAWEHMRVYRPRMMLVEFAPTSYQPPFQVCFSELIKVGLAKNYTPVAATMVNVLFVANEAL